MNLKVRFELDDEPIGHGGFATVYRAIDKDLNDAVAIKMISIGGDGPRRRFLREMRLMERCDHPHVVRILAHGTEGARLWYAMPLALGSLSDEIDRIAGDESAISGVMHQVCSGLAYIHRQDVVHRDLKPDNILHISPGTWAISDFGLGKEQERLTTAITRTGDWAGTFVYAAPEQLTDAKSVGFEADIYALGKILQELVTSETPHSTEDMVGRFRQVVIRATSREKSDRHQRVEDFLEHFDTCLTEGTPVWMSPSEILASNRERLNGEMADEAAIREVMNIDFQFDQYSPEENNEMLPVFVSMSRATIEAIWTADPEWLLVVFRRFCSYIANRSFGFGFCDPLSNFCIRVCRVTRDPRIIHVAIISLLALGKRHNRWHVQGVIIKLLQDARSQEDAAVALTALRSADRSDVRWALNDFAVGSLHPLLRGNMPTLLVHEVHELDDDDLDVPF